MVSKLVRKNISFLPKGEYTVAKLYEEVYRALKNDIHTRYQIGSFLPPERELMKHYNASRTTIRRAVALLQQDGMVEVAQGRGTQVLADHSATAEDMLLFHNVCDVTAGLISSELHPVTTHGCVVEQVPAPPEIAAEMNLPGGAPVYRMDRIIKANGKPFAFFRNYYPCDLMPGLDAFSGNEKVLFNMYSFFERQYHVYFESGEERITAQAASLVDAQLLQVPIGAPLLEMRRRAISTTHVVMDVSRRLLRPEMLAIVVSMRGAPHFQENVRGAFSAG